MLYPVELRARPLRDGALSAKLPSKGNAIVLQGSFSSRSTVLGSEAAAEPRRKQYKSSFRPLIRV